MVGMTRTLGVVGCNRDIKIVQLSLSFGFTTILLSSYEYIKAGLVSQERSGSKRL